MISRVRNVFLKWITALSIFIFALSAFAINGRTTYQAKIVKPDGYPLESSSVNFRFTVLDQTGSCVLYIEDYSAINMTDTGGLISFPLGSGTRSFPTSGTAQTFQNTFDNAIASFACQSVGIYNPNPTDTRKIVMQFNDGHGWQTLPAMSLNAVPYSMFATRSENSRALNGKADTAFVEYSTLAGLSCAADQAIKYNGVSFSCITVGASATPVTSSTVTAALGYTPADGASVTTLSSNLSTVSSSVFSVSNTVYSVSSTVNNLNNSLTSLSNSVAVSFSAITSSQWVTSGSAISYSSGSVGIGTSSPLSTLHVEGNARISAQTGPAGMVFYGGDVTAIDSQLTFRTSRSSTVSPTALLINDVVGSFYAAPYNGASYAHNAQFSFITDTASQGTGVMIRTGSGGVRVERFRITSTGNIGIGTSTPVARLDVSGGVRIGIDVTACTGVNAGTLRYNGAVVEYCNGTTWSAFGVAGAGITAVNGSTSGTQSFANGTAGTSPAFNTLNGVHTLNIPLASAGSVTAGLLSNADYTTFMGKITSSAAAVTQVLGYAPASAAALANYLVRANNLSDLTSSAVARTNLGVGYIGTLAAVDLSSADVSGTLAIARTPSYVGDVTKASASNTLILSNSGVIAGTYTKISVDAKGRVTSSSALSNADVVSALGYAPISATAASQWVTSGTTIHFTAGNVGIGTAAPNSALEVSGTARLGKVLIGDGAFNAPSVTFANNPGTGFYNAGGFIGISVGSSLIGQFNSSSLSFNAGGAGPQIYFTGGNAANPAYAFNVDSDTGMFNPNAGGGSNELGFSTAGLERLRIASNGAVGLSVTAPTARLHLASGTSLLAPLKFSSGTLLASPQSGTMEYDGVNFYLTDAANQRRIIATGSSAGSVDNVTTINSTGSMTLNPAGGAGSVIVSSTVNSTSTNTGALVVNGGVGISGNLNVGGIISGSSQVKATGFRANQGVPNAADSSTVGYAFGSDGDTGVFSPGAGAANGIVAVYNNNVESMRIQPNAVGIGTTTPAATLDINRAVTSQTSDAKAFYVSTAGSTLDTTGGNLYNYGAYIVASSTKVTANTNKLYNVGLYASATGGNLPQAAILDATNSGSSLPPSDNNGVQMAGSRLVLDQVNNPMYIHMRRTNTSFAAPTTVISGDFLGGVGFGGFDGASYTTGNSAAQAQMRAIATETWSPTSHGAELAFATTQNGTASPQERMRLSNAGNLGLGTSSPEKKIHILTGNGDGLLLESTVNDGANLVFHDSSQGVGGVNWNIDSTNGAFRIFTEPIVSLAPMVSTTGRERMVITSGGLVGVNTNTPTYMLDVSGTFRAGNADAQGGYLSYNGMADLRMGYPPRGSAASNRAMVADMNNTLTVNYANDFGGGTFIGNNVKFSSATAYIRSQAGSALTSYGSEKFGLTLEQQYGAGGWGPAIEFRTNDNTDTWTNAAIAAKDPVDGSYSGALAFFTTAGGGVVSSSLGRTRATPLVERMRISQSGFIGIATSSPVASLDIQKNSSSGAGLVLRGGAANSSDHLQWMTSGGVLQGVIDYNGQFGIGTSAPQAPLHILSNGAVPLVFERNGILNSAVQYKNASGSVYAGLAAGGYFAVGWNANLTSNPSLVVSSTGNVGIGTTTPAMALHIASSGTQSNSPGEGIAMGKSLGNDYQIQLTQSGGTPHIDFSRGGNSDYDARISVAANNQLRLGTTSSSALMTLNGLNVGIGTTNPGSKFEVRGGDTFMEGRAYVYSNSGWGAVTPSISLAIGDNDTGINWVSDGLLQIYGNNAVRMHFAINGNTGLNRTDPSYTLDVAGTLRVTGQAYTDTGAATFTVLSDVRYKDVHGSYERGLNDLLKIGTIRYNYKKENPTGADSLHEYVGVAAQNVQEAIPEAVEKQISKEGKEFLTVNPSPIIFAMINGFRDMYNKIVQLISADLRHDREIASLKAENEKLKNKVKEFDELKAYICKKDPQAPNCK